MLNDRCTQDKDNNDSGGGDDDDDDHDYKVILIRVAWREQSSDAVYRSGTVFILQPPTE